MDTQNRIKTKASKVTVQTELGTSVTITKKEAYRLLDKLANRNITPKVEFTEIYNGRELVVISA